MKRWFPKVGDASSLSWRYLGLTAEGDKWRYTNNRTEALHFATRQEAFAVLVEYVDLYEALARCDWFALEQAEAVCPTCGRE